jgi:hypothetical protein
MLAGDPRADPAVVDLIELAGLWLAADDRPAFARTMQRLVDLLEQRFAAEADYRARFIRLREEAVDDRCLAEDLRRRYRRALLG